jgi:hypothetical protein
MATPNLNAILQAIITTTDNLQSPPPYVSNVDLGNPTFGATTVFYNPYTESTTSGTTVALPSGASGDPVSVVIVKNLDAVNNLIVGTTPGGGSPTNITLGPGGVYIYFDASGLGSGITALGLQGVNDTVLALVYVGYAE